MDKSVEESSPSDLSRVELFRGYPMLLLQSAAVCCILFVFVGVPGNLITLIALNRCKKVRNATAVFIMNLAVSDLLSGLLILPLAASTFWQRHWAHGSLLCRLFPLVRYGLLAVSLFSVLSITINRYVMIGHPTLYPRIYRSQYLGVMVGSTWVCGFGALVSTWLEKWGRFGLDPQIGSCSILPDSHGRSPKEFLFLTAFVIPCIAIVCCYARIFYIVRQTAVKSKASSGAKRRPPSSSTSGPSTSTERSSHASAPTAVSLEDHQSVSSGAFPSASILDGLPSHKSAVWVRTVVEDRESLGSVSSGGSPILGTSVRRTGSKNLGSSVVAAFRRSSQRGRMTAKDRKLLKMILVIFVAFVVCYLPITVSKIFRDVIDHRGLDIAGYVLIYLTTCINPIIYVVMSSEYRQAYKNLLMCRSGDAAQVAQGRQGTDQRQAKESAVGSGRAERSASQSHHIKRDPDVGFAAQTRPPAPST